MGGWLRLWGREPEIERHPVSRGGRRVYGGWGQGGRAAVTDKRKSVSEGNPIGGRRRRDVPTSLVHLRSTGRGDAGLVGEEGVVASLATITRRQPGYGRNPAWRRSRQQPLGRLRALATHRQPPQRCSASVVTDYPHPLSWISLDLFEGSLQESKVRSRSINRSVNDSFWMLILWRGKLYHLRDFLFANILGEEKAI